MQQIAAIEPQARRNLIRLAEVYSEATGFKLTVVSRKAHGDPPFFDRLMADERKYNRIGKRTDKKGSCTLRVYDQLIVWFATNWPPDTAFPVLDDLSHTPKGRQNGTSEGIEEQAKGRSGRGKAQGEGKDKGESEDGNPSGILSRLLRTTGQ